MLRRSSSAAEMAEKSSGCRRLSCVFEEAAKEMNKKSIDEYVIFENDKPKSSSPKCKYCKTKFSRGDLGLRCVNVDFTCYPNRNLEPVLGCTTRAIACAACVLSHRHVRYDRGVLLDKPDSPPVQIGVSPAKCAVAAALHPNSRGKGSERQQEVAGGRG